MTRRILKWLVCLSGFLPLGFSVTGFAMWWIKHRRTSRPAGPEAAIDPVLATRRAGE